MLVLGIIGHPVAHSKSPAMHSAAAKALDIEAVYLRFDVAPELVGDAVRGIRALSIDGVNVTVPHKQAVMPFLDEISPYAAMIGAVNTIVRNGDRLVGHNTDGPGLFQSLVEAEVSPVGAHVTVLGAGGAARAAVVGLASGAKAVSVVARRPEQARALVDDLARHFPAVPITAHAETELETLFRSTTLLVQSTSATLEGSPTAESFAERLPLHALPASAAVVDLVYKPLETSVLRRARERGLRTVDGLGMLLHQGAIAFELWTHQAPPIDVMRAALAG